MTRCWMRDVRYEMNEVLNQIKFLRRIRTALGHAPDVSRDSKHLLAEGPSAEDLQLLDRVRQRTAADRQTLLERLIEAGKPINLNVIPLPDSAYATAAIARLVTEKNPEWGEAKKVTAWRHPLIESLNLPEALDRLQVPVHVTAPIPPPPTEGSTRPNANASAPALSLLSSG